jgi:hypothetical protein
VADAEKKARELGWQVKMMAEPAQIGGSNAVGAAAAATGAVGRMAGVFDLFGCAINYNRRGDRSAAPAGPAT